MSFRAPSARTPGGEFFSGAATGAVFRNDNDGNRVLREPELVATIGEGRIAQADKIRRQPVERIFKGAPRSWKVTNRAQQGHVKVWMGAFDGEAFPEGATDDKRTWLQPGTSMLIPIEAGLHFFGNVFDPRAPEALEVIERMGGLELETQRSNPGRNPEVRVIGGPIGLPDFIIEPIDGRMRLVGEPVALYDAYKKAWIRKVHVRKGQEPDVLETEKLLLAERIAEYTAEDMPLYDGAGRVASTAQSRAEEQMGSAFRSRDGEQEPDTDDDDESKPSGDGVPDMRNVPPENEPPPKY